MRNACGRFSAKLLVVAICTVSVLSAQNSESTPNPGRLNFDQSPEAAKPNKISAIRGLTAVSGDSAKLPRFLSQSSLAPEFLRGGSTNLVNFDKSAATLASALSANPALSEVTPGVQANPVKVKGLAGMAVSTGDNRFARFFSSRNSKEFLPAAPDRK